MNSIEEYINMLRDIFKKNEFSAPEEEFSKILKNREGKTYDQLIKEINDVANKKLDELTGKTGEEQDAISINLEKVDSVSLHNEMVSEKPKTEHIKIGTNLNRNNFEKYAGFASTILLSIITVIAGLMIIAILNYLY